MSNAASAADAADRDWRPSANRWIIAGSVTVGTFMEVLDSTIVNVSLPHIAGSLSISVDDATWIVTSYLIANGMVIPVSGWLSTVFGRKRYFLLSLGLFTLFSTLCGLATSLPQLVIFRLLQGLCGGGLQTTQQTILLDTFPESERPKAFAFSMITVIMAPVIGPTLGGFITDHLSWRWVFLINLPIGIIACLVVAAVVEDPPWELRSRAKGAAPIDYIGLSLLALGLGCFQITLDRGEDDGWFDSRLICVMASLSVCSLVAAFVWLSEKKNPIIDLKPLSNKNFVLGILMISAAITPFFSVNVLLPQMVEAQFGYTALLAGLVLSPGGVGAILALLAASSTWFPLSVRGRIILGLGGLGLAMFNLGRITPDADFTTILIMRCIQGSIGAFIFVPVSTVSYSTIAKSSLRDATCLFSMTRNIISSVGVSVTTALVVQRSQVHMAYLSQNLTPFNFAFNQTASANTAALQAMGMTPSNAATAAGGQFYQTLIRQSTIMAYSDVFEIAGLVSLCALPLAFMIRMPPKTVAPALSDH